MKRIFLTLATLSTLALVAAFVLGWQLEDATALAAQADVSRHMLVSLAALVFAALVHALVLTYFMGTGRWLEETGQAYHLEKRWHRQNQRLKYRTIPAMVVCLTLLVLVGASGGGADPAAPIRFAGWAGLSAAEIHLWLSCVTLALNFIVNAWEYRAIDENGRLVQDVLAEVRRIRSEKGLPVVNT
jgi:hypothetical protein